MTQSTKGKLKLVIDFDDTLVDTRSAILSLYKQSTGDLEVRDLKTHYYPDFCPGWTEQDINPLFEDASLFNILDPIDPVCQGIINYLRFTNKYDMVLCSLHRVNGIREKQKRLEFLFGKDTFHNTIFLTNIKDNKDYIVADIFIDDNLNNLITNKSKKRILFDKYGLYDRDYVRALGIIYVTNWYGVIREGGL